MKRIPEGALYKRGNRWYLRFKYQTRQYRWSLQTSREDEAERAADRLKARVKAAILEGRFFTEFDPEEVVTTSKPVERLLLKDAWALYVNSCRRSDTCSATLTQHTYQFGIFLDWAKTRKPKIESLLDVTDNIAGEFMRYLMTKRKISPSTFNKYRNLMRAIFRVLHKEAHIDAPNPWADILSRRWDEQGRRRKDFTVQEASKIMQKAKGWLKTLFCLGFCTGQRLVDCCSLKWEQVDLAAGLVKIVPMKTRKSTGLLVELPLHPDLKKHLQELWEKRSGSSPYVLPKIAALHRRDTSSLCVKIGTFLSECGFTLHKEGTGVNGVRALPQYGFHSCRHTFVTICRNAGVPDSVIKAIAGGSFETYTHGDLASKRLAMDKMPSFLPEEDATQRQPVVIEALEARMSDDQLQDMLARLEAELNRRRKNPAA